MSLYPQTGDGGAGYPYKDITNAVKLTGAQSVAGVKTFPDGVIANVTGNVTGNATTATTTTNAAKKSGQAVLALAATTSVAMASILAGDIVLLTPADAEAAGVIKGGTNTPNGIYVTVSAGVGFVLNHDNHADAAGATFNYVVVPAI